jgi:hypothetical protein
MIHGLPRTASTALQNILAEDPHWRYLRGWEADQPFPPPVADKEDTDPRFLREKAFIEQDTTFKGKHIHTVGGPVEDTGLMRLNFGALEMGWPIYPYMRHWRDRSMASSFTYHAKALRLLQVHRPPNNWLLKSPPHCFHIEDLVGVYPNSEFVMTHRNPAKIIPSVCSLVLTRYRTYLPDEDIDPKALGQFVLEHFQIGIDRAIAYRQREGDDRFLDVHHEEFNADPFAVLRRIYGWLDVELTPSIETRMAEWSQIHRRGAHGEHHYTAEEFGLTEAQIKDAFSYYIKTYDLRG